MALSTEWVALKTGQSGSGGVEYSFFEKEHDPQNENIEKEVELYEYRQIY